MNQTTIGSYIAKKRRPQNLTQEQLSVAEILAGVWIIGKQVLHKSFLHLYTQKEPLPRPIRASIEAPRLFSDIGVRGEIGTYFRSNSEIMWGMIVFLTFTLRSACPAVFTPSQDSVSAFFPAPQLAKALLPVGDEGCISFSSHAQLVQSIGQLVLAR